MAEKTKPVPGKPYPRRWPHRATLRSGRVVHAVRCLQFAGQDELRTACGEGMASARGAFWVYWHRRGDGAQVTCKACLARLRKPLSRVEAMAFGWAEEVEP